MYPSGLRSLSDKQVFVGSSPTITTNIGDWCNGNTREFDSRVICSSQVSPAIKRKEENIMMYVKFEGGTGFCGETFEDFEVYKEDLTQEDLLEIAEDKAIDNALMYYDCGNIEREDYNSQQEYEDALAEDEDNYLEGAYCSYTILTKEEYEELWGEDVDMM